MVGSFLRRLIDLSTTVHSLLHHISINSEARKDIQWWVDFLPLWNGVGMFQDDIVSSNDIKLFTDASFLGLGGYYDGQWFSVPFNNTKNHSISYLELLAIVVSVFCWGDDWCNKQIVLFTDNEAIVHIWSSGSCKCAEIMSLVRKLFFFTAKRNINLLLRHIPGVDNKYADSLSRLQVAKFKAQCLQAHAIPTELPQSMLSLLQAI